MSDPLRCPEHGQMNWSADRNLFVCHGWDGEGCWYWAIDERLWAAKKSRFFLPLSDLGPRRCITRNQPCPDHREELTEER